LRRKSHWLGIEWKWRWNGLTPERRIARIFRVEKVKILAIDYENHSLDYLDPSCEKANKRKYCQLETEEWNKTLYNALLNKKFLDLLITRVDLIDPQSNTITHTFDILIVAEES
jgi:hypothetical protein